MPEAEGAESAPLIYADLIEEHPLHFDSWCETEGFTSISQVDLPKVEGSYRAYRIAFQPFRVLIKSGDNNRTLFRSSERYFNKADAIHAAEIVLGSRSNVYLRQREHGNELLRLAQK